MTEFLEILKTPFPLACALPLMLLGIGVNGATSAGVSDWSLEPPARIVFTATPLLVVVLVE